MAIIEQEMMTGKQPAAQPPAQGMRPQAGAVDPNAQQATRALGLSMMKRLYDKKITPELLNIIRNSEDPVAGVAQAAMMVVDGLDQSQQAKSLPPKSMVSIATAAVVFLFELADAAKIVQSNPSMIQKAQAMLQQKMSGQQQAAPAPEGEGLVETQAANEEVEA
jgi:hypothetical protein